MNTIAHQVAHQVAQHALANYTSGGWDWVAECWTVEDIQKRLDEEGITTLEEAIKEFGAYAALMKEREDDCRYE